MAGLFIRSVPVPPGLVRSLLAAISDFGFQFWGCDIIAPMDSRQVKEQFQVGYQDAKFKSHKDALLRALIHGSIIGIAIFYPAAWWKRIVGALVAFFVVGLVGQFRAIRRERRAPDA
jgi:hypothetical protein